MDELRWKCIFHRRVLTGTQRPSSLKSVKVKRASQTGGTAKAATANGLAAWRTTASATRWVPGSCWVELRCLKRQLFILNCFCCFTAKAKIMCSSICKCIGCKNFEESPERKTLMHLADAAEVRVQQQTAAKTKLSSQISDLLTRTTPVLTSGAGRYRTLSSAQKCHSRS